jgi:hypothetical protein
VQGVGLGQAAERMVEQGHSSAYAVAVLRAVLRHGQQRIDGLPRGGLHTTDGALDQFPASLTVGGADTWDLQPTPDRRHTDAGLVRGRGLRRLGQQGRNHGLLLGGQFLTVSAHLRSPALFRCPFALPMPTAAAALRVRTTPTRPAKGIAISFPGAAVLHYPEASNGHSCQRSRMPACLHYLLAARTSPRMRARNASGSVGQAAITVAKSGGKCAAFCAASPADVSFSAVFCGLFDSCRG